ncbi:MAG TPA: hypothetical protein VFK86_17470 [Bauldia sp.]|nr:hypothetical protein [Bauldia sp.]
MEAAAWIQVLFLGGLAGALGQSARAVVGIKKVNDQAAAEQVATENLIVASRLFISLVIGFVAGALAALIMNVGTGGFDTAQILGLAATGYAGTDFIEGIINKVTPTTPVPKVADQTQVPAGPQARAGQAAPDALPADDYQG